jgi:hypothetical protein
LHVPLQNRIVVKMAWLPEILPIMRSCRGAITPTGSVVRVREPSGRERREQVVVDDDTAAVCGERCVDRLDDPDDLEASAVRIALQKSLISR